MKQIDKDISYWANMLNESFGDQLNERRMAGPAAAAKGGIDEIAQMRQMLQDGVVEFEFWKHDPDGGSDIIRHAVGTTSELVIPTSKRQQLDPNYDKNLESYKHREAFIIWFWDLEKNAVRCFNTNRFEKIIKTEKVTSPITGNITKVGNIFIHKDIDDGMMQDSSMTPTSAETSQKITSDIKEKFNSMNGSTGWEDAVPGAMVIDKFQDIEYTVNEQGEPMLFIQFAKNGSKNDPPYQLCVNEMLQYILDKYNVIVKDVRVEGRFKY